jgi:hypothetical protein
MSGPNIDAALKVREHRLADLRAEVARLRGQVARAQVEIERLRHRAIACASGDLVICRKCGASAPAAQGER